MRWLPLLLTACASDPFCGLDQGTVIEILDQLEVHFVDEPSVAGDWTVEIRLPAGELACTSAAPHDAAPVCDKGIFATWTADLGWLGVTVEHSGLIDPLPVIVVLEADGELVYEDAYAPLRAEVWSDDCPVSAVTAWWALDAALP